MSNESKENEDSAVINGYPEKTPGTFESYMEISDYLECSSNALDALGDLMACARIEQLNEFTIQGVGHLLKMLGNDVLARSFDVSEIAWKIPEEQRQHRPGTQQGSVETSQDRA